MLAWLYRHSLVGNCFGPITAPADASSRQKNGPGALSAEARVARFLVSLADRFAAMGYSSKLFNLRMTRHEIGSYLGLTLETVSRTLSAFNEIGLITVDQRTIGIKDPEALKTLRRLPPSRSRAKQTAAKQKAELDQAAGDTPALATA